MCKIKIGVIGVGNMGKNHVRLLTEMKEDFEFHGVFDLNKEHVIKTGYKGKIFDSAEELMLMPWSLLLHRSFIKN